MQITSRASCPASEWEPADAAVVHAAVDQEEALARIREIQAHFPGAARAAQLDQRTPEEIQAELDHLAELRSQFKGAPLTSEEIIAAIGRDSHPRELEPISPVQRPLP